jgi:hypothetical protein
MQIVVGLSLTLVSLSLKVCSLQSKQISGFFWISEMQKPQIYTKMGFYDSTMALSTGFTVGLDVNDRSLSTRTEI